MTDPEKLLQTSDWYDHEGPHSPFGVTRGASIGYWFGQPTWRQEQKRRRWDSVPAYETYSWRTINDCCLTYGFRKGYRFRAGDFSDRQSDEEIRRFTEKAKTGPHWHNALAVARGTAIGFAAGRANGIGPRRVPADMIKTCCAAYGFWEGCRVGCTVFFDNATSDERARYDLEWRIRRNEDGWG